MTKRKFSRAWSRSWARRLRVPHRQRRTSAVALLKTVSPDLIISDINLAGQSGLTLCERLKQDHASMADVPVMFLSGAQIPDIIRRAHAAGGTYYLRKPFDPQVLLELVDKALWMPHLAGPACPRLRSTESAPAEQTVHERRITQ